MWGKGPGLLCGPIESGTADKSGCIKIDFFYAKMFDRAGRLLYIAFHDALVAQLDRATGYEPVGQEFESLRAHHANSGDQFYWSPFLLCTVAFRKACISVSVLHPAAYCKAAPGSCQIQPLSDDSVRYPSMEDNRHVLPQMSK